MLQRFGYFVSTLLVVCYAQDTITRDVAVIGGGASGTYAAIALRDANFTVAVVEKSQQLGGHTHTYTDPSSGKPVDYGVSGLGNTDTAKDYLARLGITTTVADYGVGNFSFFDFESGEHNPFYVMQDPTAALKRFVGQLAQYPYLNISYDLPEDVPDDLLIPFGDFIQKHDLGDAFLPLNLWAMGFGDILEIPSLYILQRFNGGLIRAITGNGLLFPSDFNISSIYDRAAQILGDDVFFGSSISAATRDADPDGHINLTVDTGACEKTLKVKRLIVTIPPLIGNDYLGPFDLDTTEKNVFSKFKYFQYFAAAVREPAIPAGLSIQNVSPGNMSTPYFYPDFPSAYYFFKTPAPDVYITAYGGLENGNLTEDEARQAIEDAMQRLRNGGDYNTTTTEPFELVAFANHSPHQLHVCVDDIKAGFYKDLYALQGHLNTWWTGAAFVAHDSEKLWEYTAEVFGSPGKIDVHTHERGRKIRENVAGDTSTARKSAGSNTFPPLRRYDSHHWNTARHDTCGPDNAHPTEFPVVRSRSKSRDVVCNWSTPLAEVECI
ncbi:hypothetical protein F5Y15DRAFT_413002 [Xylariaceae sp. FL0016]|nr:hypothetical protein F5Y15DRAFT_413002 [Xylariaceae sp. FL0016]